MKEPIDWDIVFALMQCFGMLDEKGFPCPKEGKKVRILKRRQLADKGT